MKIRRKTRKRGGMVPRRISSSRNSSSSTNAPSGISPPPTYNGRPPPFSNMLSQPSNRRQPVNRSPVSPPVSFNAASSSNVPPSFNAPLPPPIYTPETHEIGTGMNAPESREMATGTNRTLVSNMATSTNRASVSNTETQTNNNNGRNIPNMTEDQLLQQYTSVYEKITSKEDAAESVALLKPHLKTIQNPIALYIFAHMDINNDGREIYKNATLHAYFITRNDVHFLMSTFKGFPRNSSYPTITITMPLERATALGFPNGKTINTLTSYHVTHQFKKPLDTRLIRMFQTISKIPAIGQTTTGWMPHIFQYPNIPIGNPLTNGLFMTVFRAL